MCAIVGEAPATWALREELAKSAAKDYDVLIQGESGTGRIELRGCRARV
jgi:DNA-binding NtrC family response regulator